MLAMKNRKRCLLEILDVVYKYENENVSNGIQNET